MSEEVSETALVRMNNSGLAMVGGDDGLEGGGSGAAGELGEAGGSACTERAVALGASKGGGAWADVSGEDGLEGVTAVEGGDGSVAQDGDGAGGCGGSVAAPVGDGAGNVHSKS